jgi:hypothetical protein
MPARIVAMVAAALVTLLSLGLLAAGGVLLWADGQKDSEGYITTDGDRFASSTNALATDTLDVDLDGAEWILNRDNYGKVRLTVESRNGKPVFVGIGRTSDVSRYLAQSPHDLVTDVEYSPFRSDYRRVAGGDAPERPGAERFWAASASGEGPQTVEWEVEDGSWSIVAMNADATRGVDVNVRAGAELPVLGTAGWVTLAAGLIGLGFAAGLTVIGIRAGRRRAVAA